MQGVQRRAVSLPKAPERHLKPLLLPTTRYLAGGGNPRIGLFWCSQEIADPKMREISRMLRARLMSHVVILVEVLLYWLYYCCCN